MTLVLNPTQETNVKAIVASLKKVGILNTCLQAGILAVVFKESDFMPISEHLMYSFPRIKQLWPNLTDEEAHAITGNPEAMANHLYGGKCGNAPDEGYKYRGRGFNQITFKGEYTQFGKETGHDLVSNPDLLDTAPVAADCLSVFFRDALASGFRLTKFKKFGIATTEDIKDPNHGCLVAIQCNGGLGIPFKELPVEGKVTPADNPILAEGYAKAVAVVNELVKYTA